MSAGCSIVNALNYALTAHLMPGLLETSIWRVSASSKEFGGSNQLRVVPRSGKDRRAKPQRNSSAAEREAYSRIRPGKMPR
jgi:hypothetical protein